MDPAGQSWPINRKWDGTMTAIDAKVTSFTRSRASAHEKIVPFLPKQA